MDYFGEDTGYYNNCNTNYDMNCNRNISYNPTYNPPEYCANPPRNPDVYQYDGVAYLNENYYDPRGEKPFVVKGYQNYFEDELFPSHFMNQERPKVLNNPYSVNPTNAFFERGNVSLHNDINRKMQKCRQSKKSNRSHSVESSVNKKNNGLNIHINGRKVQKDQGRINKNDMREESLSNWIAESTYTDKITEDTNSYINEQENEEGNYSSNYQQFENAENERTMIININYNHLKNIDTSDDSDNEDAEEICNNITKKPMKPKKIFMGKYLFSDIKKSFMYPLTICAPIPTLIAPNPGCWHYKLIQKSRREKDRKPQILVRY